MNVYACVCVYIYIYIYLYICICIYVCMYVYIHTYKQNGSRHLTRQKTPKCWRYLPKRRFLAVNMKIEVCI